MSSQEQGFSHKVLSIPGTMLRYLRGAFTFPQKHRAQNDRIGQLEAKLAEPRPEEALVPHIPAILNYVTSFSHTSAILERRNKELEASLDDARRLLETHGQSLKEVHDRIEFVRREMLFEFLHGKPGGAEQAATVEGKIVNEEKLAAMGDEVRVNLGCGNVPIEDFINIDARELPGVDIVAEVTDLPFSDNSIAEIYSSHLVEHFPQEEFKRQVLPYWYRILKPGGVIRATLPDWEAMIAKFSRGSYPFDDLREVTFGAQDYEGDHHFNMFSQDSLSELLRTAGFMDVSFPVAGRVNGKSLEMEVVAVK